MIALQTNRRLWSIWKDDFQWTVPITFVGSICGGGVLAVAYAMLGLPGVGLVSLPVLAIGYSFHLYTIHTRAQVEQLDRLHALAAEFQIPIEKLSDYFENLHTGLDNLHPDQRRVLELATRQTERVSELVREVATVR